MSKPSHTLPNSRLTNCKRFERDLVREGSKGAGHGSEALKSARFDSQPQHLRVSANATVASARPHPAGIPRMANSSVSATVVLLTGSSVRYSARIAPMMRTEAAKRRAFMGAEKCPSNSNSDWSPCPSKGRLLLALAAVWERSYALRGGSWVEAA